MHVSHRFFSFISFLLLLIFAAPTAQAQAGNPEIPAPQMTALYVDCSSCDMNYLREHLPYVNYVRDPQLAQVHLFITAQGTGGGGRSYDLSFIGKKEFEGTNLNLSYAALPTHTSDEVRKGLTQRIKLGVGPYVAQTAIADDLAISMEDKMSPRKKQKQIPVNDPWKNWIFDVFGDGSFRQESSRSDIRLNYGLNADHITEDWRIRIHPRVHYRESQFENNGEKIVSIIRSSSLPASVVRSIGDHWSAGVFSSFSNSTYRNINLDAWHASAIEYSLFPYSEATRKEITVAYHTGHFYRNYAEETIYGKMQEHLWRQTLWVRVIMRQPWGSLNAGLKGSNYMHDWSKNSMELNGNLSVRVFKGLSMRLAGNLDLIHDQISLPAGNASLQDVLLQQRQLATDYEMSVSLGVSYTFGSIYNNIVNTRL